LLNKNENATLLHKIFDKAFVYYQLNGQMMMSCPTEDNKKKETLFWELRLSPTILTQNTRLICLLGSATGKRFHTYF